MLFRSPAQLAGSSPMSFLSKSLSATSKPGELLVNVQLSDKFLLPILWYVCGEFLCRGYWSDGLHPALQQDSVRSAERTVDICCQLRNVPLQAHKGLFQSLRHVALGANVTASARCSSDCPESASLNYADVQLKPPAVIFKIISITEQLHVHALFL